MKFTTTERGFALISFLDHYGEECSLQKSSLATEDAIWLGVSKVRPQIMSSDAIRLGLREKTNDEGDNGWVDFEIPKEVLLSSRMHLTREQVQALLPYLIEFVTSGVFQIPQHGVTKKEYKELLKSLYPKDNSGKFSR